MKSQCRKPTRGAASEFQYEKIALVVHSLGSVMGKIATRRFQ